MAFASTRTRPVGRLGLLALLALAALLVAPPASAASGPTAKEKAFERSIRYRKGTLRVQDARIVLPRGFRYLASSDAQRTVTELYGNPPHEDVLAMILPPKSGVLDNRYFIVVTYEDEGHVDDEDAAEIDYDEMLKSMQESEEADNAERTASGYEPIHMVGWAEHPRYDARTHKLYWASNLKFGQDPVHTLNYEVRTLGREGMLALNAVAAMQDIEAVRAGMQKVLKASRFVEGRAYEDYRKGDKVSNLTIAAVVAGGAYTAAKTGLIAVVLAKLKFVLVGLLALFGAVARRLFRRRSSPVA